MAGPASSFWNPTQALANLLYNNTSMCYAAGENCAPQVGSTSMQSLFPGMREVRFTGVSASSSGGTATLSVPAGQGCCAAGGSNGVYNFSSTDHIVVAGLASPFNGTFALSSAPVSGNPGLLKYALAGTATSTGGTVYRSNQAAQDQYIPAPANIANCVNDGVCIHDMPWPGYDGYIFIHEVPFQHCPTPVTTSCLFTPKPNLATYQSHTMVGYESYSLTQVTAQYNFLLRLKLPTKKMGLVHDWSGGPVTGASTTRKKENGVADFWIQVASGNSQNFRVTMAHDNSGWDVQAVATACGLGTGAHLPDQNPTCVEKFIESSLQYEHTAKTSNYISVLDGQPYAGGGYFASSAYLRDPATGHPLNFSFINGEGSMFTNCTTGAPCPIYNAGVPGTTCTSSSDCWNKVKQGIANFIAGWGIDAPEFIWRNSFTNNTVPGMNAGDMDWINPTTDASNEAFNTSRISQAGVGGSHASMIYVPFSLAHLSHANSDFQDDPDTVGGRCGQLLNDWMSKIYTFGGGVYFGPGVKTPLGIQIGTLNDNEEGTGIEAGVPICYNISATISGNLISWSLSTTDTVYASLSPLNGTLDHVALWAVKTGGAVGSNNSQEIADAPAAASGTFDLSTINMDPGNYTLYVRLVPKPLMQTKMSATLPYNR